MLWAEGLWLPLYEVCNGAAVAVAALEKPVGTQVVGMEYFVLKRTGIRYIFRHRELLTPN